jgi:hypothetical protein
VVGDHQLQPPGRELRVRGVLQRRQLVGGEHAGHVGHGLTLALLQLGHRLGGGVDAVTGQAVVAHRRGDLLVPGDQPVRHQLDLGRLRGADLLGQRDEPRLEVATHREVDHRQRLRVVLDHRPGEADVLGGVLGVGDDPRGGVLVAAGGHGGEQEKRQQRRDEEGAHDGNIPRWGTR